MRTLDKIITKVSTKRSAPMGRYNIGAPPVTVTTGKNCRITKKHNKHMRVYDSVVKLDSGGYDKGGVYWGVGPQLRVKYNKDLSYVEFYRAE